MMSNNGQAVANTTMGGTPANFETANLLHRQTTMSPSYQKSSSSEKQLITKAEHQPENVNKTISYQTDNVRTKEISKEPLPSEISHTPTTEKTGFINNSRQIIDSPNLNNKAVVDPRPQFHKSSYDGGRNRIEEINSSSTTDSPKLPPRNKPKLTENRSRNDRLSYSQDSSQNLPPRNQQENKIFENVNHIKKSQTEQSTSSISTGEKNLSDQDTTIKMTDEYLLMQNSWRITETPNMPHPLNRQQLQTSDSDKEEIPTKPHHYESIDNQNRSTTSVKQGQIGKKIGDPEIKQFYREIRPGRIDQQKAKTTAENQLTTQKTQHPEGLNSLKYSTCKNSSFN